MNPPDEEQRGGENLEAPPEVVRNPAPDNVASTPIYRHGDPRRMELSPRERDWALHIKQAIANTADLDPVSDFMCAQLALIDGINTDRAVQRVHHLQCVKEEYGILDTLQDATRRFEANLELFPRIHLCFTYLHETGEHILIYDNAKFDSRFFHSEANIRSWMCGVYYIGHLLCSDFTAIRCGATFVLENEG
jgi:hypothetical protein